MSDFHCFAPGIPRTKNKPWAHVIGGQARILADPKGQQAQRALSAVFAEHAPERILEGPVSLELQFTFPVPKSWPRWKREAALDGAWKHTSRPDLTRLVALAEDALSGVVFVDDAQVCSLTASKAYGEKPGTTVWVSALRQAASPRSK